MIVKFKKNNGEEFYHSDFDGLDVVELIDETDMIDIKSVEPYSIIPIKTRKYRRIVILNNGVSVVEYHEV